MAELPLGATTNEGNGPSQAPSDANTPPAAAPAAITPPASTPQEPSQGETPEAKIERLEREAVQARTLQAQADRRAQRAIAARKRAERLALRGESASEQDDDTQNNSQVPTSNVEVERAKAERSMVQKAYSDPKYRAVIDSDPTLKRLLETNPLALVNNPVDSEDAVFQLEDLLDERVSAQSTPSPKTPTAPVGQGASPAPAAEFTPGATNPVTPPSSPQHVSSMKSGNFEAAVDEKMRDQSQWNKPAAE